MLSVGLGVTSLGLASCAAFNPHPSVTTATNASPAAVPLVQNCGVLQAGTPSRFVCNGKVYTSFQLAKLREDEAKRYASGK